MQTIRFPYPLDTHKEETNQHWFAALNRCLHNKSLTEESSKSFDIPNGLELSTDSSKDSCYFDFSPCQTAENTNIL